MSTDTRSRTGPSIVVGSDARGASAANTEEDDATGGETPEASALDKGTAAALSEPVYDLGPWIENLYASAAAYTVRSVQDEIADRKLQKIAKDDDLDLDQLQEDLVHAYHPGRKEVSSFRINVGDDQVSHPCGYYYYPVGFRGSRSGRIMFQGSRFSAADFIVATAVAGSGSETIAGPAAGTGDAPPAESAAAPVNDVTVADAGAIVSHPVSLVSGWQDKLKELIFYASPAIGDDDVAAFIRPPQAAYETTGHPGKLSERSPLARGYRAPSPAALKEGRFEVVMHCKAPGFRTASKTRDTKPKCHAALRVEINSKDAKFATVTIMEPCVHRARCFAQHFVDEDGRIVSVPAPEPFSITVTKPLKEAIRAELNETVVDTNQTVQPLGIHGGIFNKTPFIELVTGNLTRTGGSHPDEIRRHVTSMRRGEPGKEISESVRAKNDAIQRLVDERPDILQRCEHTLSHRVCIVVMDKFRVAQFDRYVIDGGNSGVLDYRGVVLDYAMKFCRRVQPGKDDPLWTLLVVLPHPNHPETHGAVLTLVEAIVLQANAYTTAEVLQVLYDAAQQARNHADFWVPAFVADMSRVLALAIAKVFNRMTFNQTMEKQRDILRRQGKTADEWRSLFWKTVTKLRSLAGEPEGEPADKLPSPHQEDANARDATAVGSSRTVRPDPKFAVTKRQVEALTDLGCPRADIDAATSRHDIDRLFSQHRDAIPAFAPSDPLAYVQDRDAKPREQQLRLVLAPGAADALERWKDAAVEKLGHDSLDADIAATIDSLLKLNLPTINEFRDAKLSAMVHCLSHKAKAVVRATKVAPVFKQLGKGVRSWATRIAYGLIIAPFGRECLHDPATPSPFVGPKDTIAFDVFNSVIAELLKTQYICIDSSKWPGAWRQVIRLRRLTEDNEPLSASETPPRATMTTRATASAWKEVAYVFEVFAKNIRVVHAKVYRRRLVRGRNITRAIRELDPATAAANVSPCKTPPTTDLVPEVDNDDEFIDFDQGLDQGVDQGDLDALCAEIDAEDAAYQTECMRADDSACIGRELAGDWMSMADPQEMTPGDILTSIVAEPAPLPAFESDEVYFECPLFLQTAGTVRSQPVVRLPLASLFAYHEPLQIPTGPCMRGLFPTLEHTSSTVESAFSKKRAQQTANLPYPEYLRALVGRGSDGNIDSITDRDRANFLASCAESHRAKESRVSKPKPRVAPADAADATANRGPGETWKGRRDELDPAFCQTRTMSSHYTVQCKTAIGSCCAQFKLCAKHCRGDKYASCTQHAAQPESTPLTKAAMEIEERALNAAGAQEDDAANLEDARESGRIASDAINKHL